MRRKGKMLIVQLSLQQIRTRTSTVWSLVMVAFIFPGIFGGSARIASADDESRSSSSRETGMRGSASWTESRTLVVTSLVTRGASTGDDFADEISCSGGWQATLFVAGIHEDRSTF
jgi:hypothetical protein